MPENEKPEFTADQIVAGIAAALRARDIHAVPGLIALLALQDPGRAELIMTTLKIATGKDLTT